MKIVYATNLPSERPEDELDFARFERGLMMMCVELMVRRDGRDTRHPPPVHGRVDQMLVSCAARLFLRAGRAG